MAENLAGALVLVALFGFIILRARRRATLTPEQRRIEDLEYKQRKMERELRRHKTYGG